ncbi:MAG: methyltransferase domain-containing protein [Planctomycetota bacterium]
MQEHLRAFLGSVSEAFPLAEPIYEFGYGPGFDATGGQMPKAALPGKGHLACREAEPAVVERLEDLARLPFPDGAARTVIAIHALERTFEPHRAVEEMIRILAPGGILVLSSQSAAQSPESANRYWHPTPGAIQRLLAGLEATLIGWQGDDGNPHTLFGIAAKPPVAEAFFAGAGRFLDGFQKRLDEIAARAGWWPRLKRRLMEWKQGRQPGDTGVPFSQTAQRNFKAEKRIAISPRSAGSSHKAQFVLHLPVPDRLKHRLLASCLPEENLGTRLDTTQ